MNKGIAVLSSVRTPVGLIAGILSSMTEQELAAHAMKAAAGETIFDDPVDEIILGVSKQTSKPSNCARHAALLAGFPNDLSAYTVQRQSASGLQAVYNACMNIRSRNASVVIAGGCESASNMPVEVRGARYSFGPETRIIFDTAATHEAGAQPHELYGRLSSRIIADRIAIRHNITKEEIMSYSELSLEQASQRSLDPGLVLEVRTGKKTTIVSCDQLEREPGDLPTPADGAAVQILAEKSPANKSRMLAEIIAFCVTASTPDKPEDALYKAILGVLDQSGLTLDRLNQIEMGEASAACTLAVLKRLNKIRVVHTNLERIVNPYGGMLAYGNAWGASGSILLDRLIQGLQNGDGGYGIAVTFAEGGQAIALLLRVDA